MGYQMDNSRRWSAQLLQLASKNRVPLFSIVHLIIIKATHFPTKLLNPALEVYQKEVTFFHKNTVAGNEILPALTEMRKLSYIINNTYRIKLRKPIQISISQLCRSGSVFSLLCGPSLKEIVFGIFHYTIIPCTDTCTYKCFMKRKRQSLWLIIFSPVLPTKWDTRIQIFQIIDHHSEQKIWLLTLLVFYDRTGTHALIW